MAPAATLRSHGKQATLPSPAARETMIPGLPSDIDQIKGFLSGAEARALYDSALEASAAGAVLEIGSYCGKSTIYLGLACQQNGSTLFALDHHRGSEEHQQGECFHDPALFDPGEGLLDTFREFRRNMRRAALDDTVVPIVSDSETTARHWRTPLAMVFIDGGHSLDAALADYRCWAPQLKRGGILAIHDLYPSAHDGGQAPLAIYRMALASGLFEATGRVDSLGLLRRL
jgi:MMP 1-O-methyltransferase